MSLRNRRLFQLIGIAWYACAIAYGINVFFTGWIGETIAAGLLLAAAALCLIAQALVARRERRSLSEASVAREKDRRKQATAVGDLWKKQLMKLSIDYLRRQDDQAVIGRVWREEGPSVQLMQKTLQLRLECLADSAHAEQLQDLAHASINQPPEHLLQLSLMIRHGCMIMSLWAPGDEYMPMMPGMDELAPLTMQLD